MSIQLIHNMPLGGTIPNAASSPKISTKISSSRNTVKKFEEVMLMVLANKDG